MEKIINVFIYNLLSRVEKVISVCEFGSRIKNNNDNNDIDLFILIDDSSRINKEYVKEVIKKIGKYVDNKLHCQVFFLTELWRFIENGSPITYTILRDGVIYYDLGFFNNLQKLTKMGVIKPKYEAAERQLSIAKELMNITYHTVKKGFIQNIQGAIVSSVQALLINMGKETPTPKDVPEYIKKYLINNKILSEQYYNIAKEIITTYKDIEHNKRKGLTGEELQRLYNNANNFITRIEEIMQTIKKNKI